MEKTITLYTGRNGMRIMDASFKYEADPSEENKRIKDFLFKDLNIRIKEGHELHKERFIESYGDKYNFIINNLNNKKDFLYAVQPPFVLNWTLFEDYEEDYYISLIFYKGVFNTQKGYCGGYAGVETIERNLSNERVLELLKEYKYNKS